MPTAVRRLLVLSLLTACTNTNPDISRTNPLPASPPAKPGVAVISRSPDDPLPPEAPPPAALPDQVAALIDRPFTGDLDQMVKRRLIRAGTVYNRTHYFIDKGSPRGLVHDALRQFEADLNKGLDPGLSVHVAAVPLPRDQLFTALQSGRVDMVAAALTVTPAREKAVAFSAPTLASVNEVVITPSGGPRVTSPEQLAGQEVFVRRSSSYYESLQRLNQALSAAGRLPVQIKAAPEALEDEDILEMVNAGLISTTIMDDYMAAFWRQVFPNVQVHPARLRTGAVLAAGVRKGNARLLAAVNAWLTEHGSKSPFAGALRRQYLQNTTYVKNAAADAERDKLLALVRQFEVYGEKYGVDYLLMAAQGYQESGLDQSVRGPSGAIGVMQILPATATELAVGDVTELEHNIHAGVKYFRFMMDEFFRGEPMDDLNKGLMTLAAYSCGPGRIRQLRQETAARGLDPNLWFGNVERVTAERLGRDSVAYVSNIYKYYVAYTLVMDRERQRRQGRDRQ